MAKVASTPRYRSASSQRCSHFPRVSVTTSPHRQRRPAPILNGTGAQSASVLGELERRFEDVAGVLVALAFHLLQPLFPEWLAGSLVPARDFRGRNVIAV